MSLPLTGAGPSAAGVPTTPVLSLDDVTDATATFSAVIDDTVGTGDSRQFQIQADGGDWTVLEVDDTDTISSGEDAADQIDVSASLTNGDKEARIRVREGTGPWSAWSNVVDFTIAVVSWTPADLSGLVAWYEADQEVYSDAGTTPATDTDLVYQWNDLSGNGHHLIQATSGNRPTYRATGLNSTPCIELIAASETYMLSGTNRSIFATGTDVSMMCAVEMHSETDAFARLVAYVKDFSNDSDSGSCVFAGRWSTNNGLSAMRAGQIGEQAVSFATPYIFGVVFNGTNGTTYLDNANATSTANTDAFGSSEVGALGLGVNIVNNQAVGTQFFDGKVAVIVITQEALSTDDRNSLYAYIQSKAGF